MSAVYIIAEAGVNHNGDLAIAKALVDVAADAGADAVKFQTFQAEKMVCKNAAKAAYQKETTDAGETQFDMLKRLELTRKMHIELIAYCKMKNIQFLSSPFDLDSIKLLAELEVPVIKIPSGEITNYPYLKLAGQTGKDIILSTGMSSMHEIREAVEVLKKYRAGRIVVLHCNTQYPTPVEDVNLKAMMAIRRRLNVSAGYSDHTQGIETAIAAAALGAAVIEKHITLNRGMEGPDHRASIEPHELKEMVRCIRNIEKALGKEEKKASPSEKDNLGIARKSITAAKKIQKGEVFTEDNLTVKRPGTGISPMKWEEVVGRASNRDYDADEQIRLDFI